MRITRVAATAVTIAAVAATMAAPASAYADNSTDPTSTDTASGCGALPSYVEGRPADLHVRGAAGDYLWHDSTGWHLRVTHRTSKRMVFRGVIVSSVPITYRQVRDEGNDKLLLSSGGRKLTFRFVNHGGIDGVDFVDDCAATMRFALAVNGHRVSRNGVYIGADSARPDRNPFVISRADPAPAA